MDADRFHAHLDRCPRCADHPFDLCLEGTRLMRDILTGVEIPAPEPHPPGPERVTVTP